MSVDSRRISQFQAKLRESGLAEATIATYLRHLKAVLRWANSLGMLATVPNFHMPKRTAKAKGRPIDEAEFNEMLAAVPQTVTTIQANARKKLGKRLKEAQEQGSTTADRITQELADFDRRIGEMVASWQHLLRGLWLSGLRISEALRLSWTDDAEIMVDLSGDHPMFRIQPESQKSNRFELLPITPDFAEFLFETPELLRTGHVFEPLAQRNHDMRARSDTTSKTIAAIGKKAGVQVGTTTKGKPKHASAHDLRRSFGHRWAGKVRPATLQALMRHSDISTTMTYYATANAKAVADEIWGGFANTSANSRQEAASEAASNDRKALSDKALQVGTTGIEPATS